MMHPEILGKICMSFSKIKTLCEQYSQVNYRERLVEVFRNYDRVLVTSSFGTTSVILLHLLHEVKPDHPVHFIDTTYHFSETHQYMQSLIDRWGLNVVHVRPEPIGNARTRRERTWAHHPDRCCQVNKVSPINRLKKQHDVWISGMTGGITEYRKNLPIFKQEGKLMRFYPLIDMTPEDADLYKTIYELPAHPLEGQGYGSIGCTHCTLKGHGRSGRWADKAKTECGLHVFA